MREQLFREFADEITANVPVADMVELESRARDLRRNRRVVAAGLAAVVLVIGLVAATRNDADTRPEPADPERSFPFDKVGMDQELASGRDYRLPVYGSEPGLVVAATFTAPGDGWLWRVDRMTRWSGTVAARDVFPLPQVGQVQLMMADRLPTRFPCSDLRLTWADARDDPLEVARQVAGVPRTRVLDAPGRDGSFGFPAAHVRISVSRVCPEVNDVLLWSLAPSSYGGTAGVGSAHSDGQVLDVWVLEIEGAMVFLTAEHGPDLPDSYGAEARALADSVEFEVVEAVTYRSAPDG